jgi:hypothetical protein
VTTSTLTPRTSDAAQANRSAPPAARRPRRGRLAVVGAMVAGLLVAGVARNWALALQTRAYENGPFAGAKGSGGASAADAARSVSSTLGSADSYFLVLMLGGLRGPLVMYLWSSSENQKNERDLEDFNTKVNLIRLLQPEFDSVVIFQSWNLAFNISVQIASIPDRYAVIMDAVRFVKQADRGRPNNVNILLQLNQMFQQKLGQTAGDSIYYKRQVRLDSKWRPPELSAAVGTLSQRMEPLLDQAGRVQPQFATPTQPRPADLPTRVFLPVARVEEFKAAAAALCVSIPAGQLAVAPGEREIAVTVPEQQALRLEQAFHPYEVRYVWADWNDGSELQYLRRYEPYPYGVSPLGLGFNYGKRAQVLINRTKQRPAQYSASVVDSRPGLELRDWGHEERDRGLAAEARAYGQAQAPRQYQDWLGRARIVPGDATTPEYVDLFDLFATRAAPPSRTIGRVDELVSERAAVLLATAATADAGTSDAADLREAVFEYDRAVMLMQDARAEYTRHLNNPEEGIRRLQDFSSHVDELTADELLTAGDRDFLKALNTPSAPERAALLAAADTSYRLALTWYRAIDLKYYAPGELFQKAGVTREAIDALITDPAKFDRVYAAIMDQVRQHPDLDQNRSNRDEARPYEERAIRRMALIARLTGHSPATAPATLPATQPQLRPAGP